MTAMHRTKEFRPVCTQHDISWLVFHLYGRLLSRYRGCGREVKQVGKRFGVAWCGTLGFSGGHQNGTELAPFFAYAVFGDRIGSARVPGRGAFPRLQGESESMPRSAVMGQQNGTMHALCLQESDFRPETYRLWDGA